MPAGKLLTYFSAVKYKKRNFSLQKKWFFFQVKRNSSRDLPAQS